MLFILSFIFNLVLPRCPEIIKKFMVGVVGTVVVYCEGYVQRILRKPFLNVVIVLFSMLYKLSLLVQYLSPAYVRDFDKFFIPGQLI